MFNPIQVANIYIEIANSEKEGSITNLKLNKLLYYAQGWSLARLGHPLFAEDILAWQLGPIVPSVYRTFSVCGKDPIASVSELANEAEITGDELQLLIDVYRYYGRYSASTLVEMTHQEGTPWHKAYNGAHSTIIPKDDIRDYFLKESPLYTFEMPKLSATIGHEDDRDDDYE